MYIGGIIIIDNIYLGGFTRLITELSDHYMVEPMCQDPTHQAVIGNLQQKGELEAEILDEFYSLAEDQRNGAKLYTRLNLFERNQRNYSNVLLLIAFDGDLAIDFRGRPTPEHLRLSVDDAIIDCPPLEEVRRVVRETHIAEVTFDIRHPNLIFYTDELYQDKEHLLEGSKVTDLRAAVQVRDLQKAVKQILGHVPYLERLVH